MTSEASSQLVWPASCLLYLFAGDELPHPHFSLSHLFTTEHAVHLPCEGGTVVLGPLECHLFAWTFWQLHDEGIVDLALEQPQATRRKRDDWLGLDVSVHRTSAEASPRGVLAEELLARCTEEPSLVSQVIVDWGEAKGVDANRMVFLPLNAIVELIHLDTCNYLGAEPLPPDRSDLDCDDIALQRPQFLTARHRWGVFADEQTDLASALVRCCDAGLARLRPPKIAALLS